MVGYVFGIASLLPVTIRNEWETEIRKVYEMEGPSWSTTVGAVVDYNVNGTALTSSVLLRSCYIAIGAPKSARTASRMCPR